MNRLRGAITDLTHSLRHGNFKAAGRRLFDHLRTFPFHRIEYLVLARSLQKPLPDLKPGASITYRVAERKDLARFKGLVSPSEFERFRERLARGRFCFLALHQGTLAAYEWATAKVNPDIDCLELQLAPGDVYINEVYTLPAWRRRNIQSALHVWQLCSLRGQGFKRAIAIVAVDNLPSRKMFEKLGYQEADRLSFRRIFFRRYYHYHNGKF
jgi:ribosomal protein S18 acetylase RimI-like enzyme